MEKKRIKLIQRLTELVHDGLCVAFSGGVDSALLLKLCTMVGGGRVVAVTMQTQLAPDDDLEWAGRLAAEMHVERHVLTMDALSIPQVRGNDRQRCYHCKKALFADLLAFARANGLRHVADGTNADDLEVYRPGRKALKELGVVSPLAQSGMTKAEIRAWARALGLSVSDRPASPCLATRLPYGCELTPERLNIIRQGERILHEYGFAVCRLRLHGDMARIEIERAQTERFLQNAGAIAEKLKALGLLYVTLDMEFFRSGRMDISVMEENAVGGVKHGH